MRFIVLNDPATTEQLGIFADFNMKLDRYVTGRKAVKYFRGDTLSQVMERMGATDNKTLAERIFMIGEKARHFRKDEQKRKSQLLIHEANQKALAYIFTKMLALKKNRRKFFIEYFRANAVLKDYFSPANRQLFYDTVAALPMHEQLLVRNYYLTLLHQLAEVGYKQISHFVSTSKTPSVARSFAAPRLNPNDGIEYLVWQFGFPTQTRSLLKRHLFPVYLPPFPAQQEHSFLAGVLPHYIIGFKLLARNEFYINPALFSSRPFDLSTFRDGFIIDQRLFPEVIRHTQHQGYFVQYGEMIVEMDLNE